MTGWQRRSTGNSVRTCNLTILPNNECTSQTLSGGMKHIKLTWILKYKHITTPPDLVKINCRLSRPQNENKSKRKEKQVCGSCQRTKKPVEHESDGYAIYKCDGLVTVPKSLTRGGGGRIGNQKTSRDHPNYSIVEIDQNTEFRWPKETCGHLDSSERPSANVGEKNLQGVIITIIKRLRIVHTNKWYMNKPESALKNETNIIFWDFEIQMSHLITARRPEQVLINKTKKTFVM